MFIEYTYSINKQSSCNLAKLLWLIVSEMRNKTLLLKQYSDVLSSLSYIPHLRKIKVLPVSDEFYQPEIPFI
jgi:hypothetical protein